MKGNENYFFSFDEFCMNVSKQGSGLTKVQNEPFFLKEKNFHDINDMYETIILLHLSHICMVRRMQFSSFLYQTTNLIFIMIALYLKVYVYRLN